MQDKEDETLTISQGDTLEHEEDTVDNEPDLEKFSKYCRKAPIHIRCQQRWVTATPPATRRIWHMRPRNC